MSDSGLYASLESEITTALTTPAGITDVVTLAAATSVVDLAESAVRKPAIGVIDAGAEDTGEISIGNRRRLARFTFEIAVVVSSARGRTAARGTLRSTLEAVRDRVHNLSSSQPGTGRWRWKSETPVEVAGDDLLAAVASYQIETTIGR